MVFYRKRSQAAIWDDLYNALRGCMFHHVEYTALPSRHWHCRDSYNNKLNRKVMEYFGRFSSCGFSSVPEEIARQYYSKWAEHDPMFKALYNVDSGEIITTNQFQHAESYHSLASFFEKWGILSRMVIPLPSPSENWVPVIFAYSRFCHKEVDYVLASEAHRLIDTLIKLNHEMMHHHSESFNPFLASDVFSDNALKIIKLISIGYSNEQVAKQVDMTKDGIKYHLKTMRYLLGARNVTHLIARSKDIQLI